MTDYNQNFVPQDASDSLFLQENSPAQPAVSLTQDELAKRVCPHCGHTGFRPMRSWSNSSPRAHFDTQLQRYRQQVTVVSTYCEVCRVCGHSENWAAESDVMWVS